MNIQEYRKWRHTYSSYDTNYPCEEFLEVQGKDMRKHLALSGLACEAAEALGVLHKDLRNRRAKSYDKIKDELSDVWWYLNMCLDEFNLTLEELSEYNKRKLDERNTKENWPSL